MYYITRVLRDKNRGLRKIFVKDSTDGVEEGLTYHQFLACLKQGIKIRGANMEHPCFSYPSPVIDTKFKLLRNIDIEISRDGTQTQYLRVPFDVDMDITSVPPLADGCVFGGRGTIVVPEGVNVNFEAFCNSFASISDIFNKEVTEYERQAGAADAYMMYEIGLKFTNLSNEEAISYYEKVKDSDWFCNSATFIFKMFDMKCQARLLLLIELSRFEKDLIDVYQLFSTFLLLINNRAHMTLTPAECRELQDLFAEYVIPKFYTSFKYLSLLATEKTVESVKAAKEKLKDAYDTDDFIKNLNRTELITCMQIGALDDAIKICNDDRFTFFLAVLMYKVYGGLQDRVVDNFLAQVLARCCGKYYLTRVCTFRRTFVPQENAAFYVKDTFTHIEKVFSATQCRQGFVDKGYEIAGFDSQNISESHPDPLGINFKFAMFKNCLVEQNSDGSEIQYISVEKGNICDVSTLPRLGDFSVAGGGGTYMVGTDFDLNFKAFMNYYGYEDSVEGAQVILDISELEDEHALVGYFEYGIGEFYHNANSLLFLVDLDEVRAAVGRYYADKMNSEYFNDEIVADCMELFSEYDDKLEALNRYFDQMITVIEQRTAQTYDKYYATEINSFADDFNGFIFDFRMMHPKGHWRSACFMWLKYCLEAVLEGRRDIRQEQFNNLDNAMLSGNCTPSIYLFRRLLEYYVSGGTSKQLIAILHKMAENYDNRYGVSRLCQGE